MGNRKEWQIVPGATVNGSIKFESRKVRNDTLRLSPFLESRLPSTGHSVPKSSYLSQASDVDGTAVRLMGGSGVLCAGSPGVF